MFAYLFEARGIQQYIIETGKVKDMIGASLIVDELCQFDQGSNDLLQIVLGELDLREPEIVFSRRAGGAFVALLPDKQKAEALRNLWTLTVHHFAPSMEWVDALAEGVTDAEVVRAGFELLAQRRNRPPATMPEASPFVLRAPRTGGAVLGKDRQGDWLDLPTSRKRQHNRDSDGVGRYFLPPLPSTEDKEYFFVESLDASEDDGHDRGMPFVKGTEQMLGVIHADGNGLGIALQQLQKVVQDRADYREVYWKFSVAIATATRAAVQAATEKVLLPIAHATKSGRWVLPARPLVLGGDDLTLIVRGDLALDFLAEFIRAFERESERELSKLGLIGLPHKLTACGGVAYIRVGQPFVQAYALAESLCTFAKKQSTRVCKEGEMKPSSLAFYRVSISHIGEYPEILDETESTRYGEVTYQMSLGAYALNSQNGLPLLDDLVDLHHALRNIPGSTERELLTLMRQAPQLARERYQRWREVLQKRNAGKLAGFDGVMARLGVKDKELPFCELADKVRRTPLGDVHALQAVLPKLQKEMRDAND